MIKKTNLFIDALLVCDLLLQVIGLLQSLVLLALHSLHLLFDRIHSVGRHLVVELPHRSCTKREIIQRNL